MSFWDLGVGIAAYFVTSLGGVAIVKFLNYHFCFSSWLVLALLSRATWVLAAPFSVYLRGGGGCCWISYRQLQIYLAVAVGLSLVEALNAMSMTVLPGSLYALTKGTDVVWSMVLSRLILRKSYSLYQIGAVLIIVAGIAAVFGMGSPQATKQHQEATEKAMQAAHVKNSSMAAVLCLLGAFCNSLLSVITEATLKETLRAEQERMSQNEQPSKLVLSNEYAAWTSFFSFLLLTVSAIATGQFSGLPVAFKQLTCSKDEAADSVGNDHTQPRKMLLILSLIVVTVSRFAERLCKHWICVRDSAMTFSVVQAARRLFGVFILAALFGEAFPRSMVTGSALAGVGFVMHSWATLKRDANRGGGSASNKEDGEYEIVSLTPPTELDEASQGDYDGEESVMHERTTHR